MQARARRCMQEGGQVPTCVLFYVDVYRCFRCEVRRRRVTNTDDYWYRNLYQYRRLLVPPLFLMVTVALIPRSPPYVGSGQEPRGGCARAGTRRRACVQALEVCFCLGGGGRAAPSVHALGGPAPPGIPAVRATPGWARVLTLVILA